MKAAAGHKWVIILTLPESKQRLVCGGHEGKLALYPINGPRPKLTNVLAWDDSKEALTWMMELLSRMTPDKKSKFMMMRPDLGQIAVVGP